MQLLLGIDMPNCRCRAPTDGQDLKLRGLPVNPSLLKGWGHKVPAATFIHIGLSQSTCDDGNYQHMETI